MAYADEARVAVLVGAALKAALGDLDDSGAVDVGFYDEVIAKADSVINRRLAQRYVMPITGTVPETIVTIANDLAIAYALRARHAKGTEWKEYRDEAFDDLDRIADGTDDVPGLTPVGPDAGRTGMSSQQLTPSVGMRHTDDDTADEGNTTLSDPLDGIF